MAQYMRGDRARNMSTVGDVLENTLDGAGGHADGVMDRKMGVNQRAYTVGEGYDPAL